MREDVLAQNTFRIKRFYTSARKFLNARKYNSVKRPKSTPKTTHYQV